MGSMQNVLSKKETTWPGDILAATCRALYYYRSLLFNIVGKLTTSYFDQFCQLTLQATAKHFYNPATKQTKQKYINCIFIILLPARQNCICLVPTKKFIKRPFSVTNKWHIMFQVLVYQLLIGSGSLALQLIIAVS